MIHMGDCGLKIPCVNCTSEVCGNAGKKQPDCPYKYCPYPYLDCETECRFIDEYIEEIRKGVMGNERSNRQATGD